MQPHLYLLGSNLILNGDCTDAAQVSQLYATYQSLGGYRIELCLTDPPYGVALGQVYGDLRPFNTLPIANDNLPDEILTEFLVQSIGTIQATFKPRKNLMFFGFSNSNLLAMP